MSLAKFTVGLLLSAAGCFFLVAYIFNGEVHLTKFFAWWLPLALWFGIIHFAFGPIPMDKYYQAVDSPQGLLQESLVFIGHFGLVGVDVLSALLNRWFEVWF